MNRAAKLLIIIALIAGVAAVISLQQGELVFVLNGMEMRSTAPAVIALLILYTLAVIVLTRLFLFLFAPRTGKEPVRTVTPSKPVSPSGAHPAEPRFVVLPRPLDAAPPTDDKK